MRGHLVDIQKLITDAVNVVDMFDQADANDIVENIGSRGILLVKAVEDLRRTLNQDRQRTALSTDQV